MKAYRLVQYLVAGTLVLAAVLGGTALAQSVPERTLVVALSGEIPTLDPDFSRYPLSNLVLLNVYEQWFQYGEMEVEGEPYTRSDISQIKGAAIESWEVSEDRMSVLLNVRQGVKFPMSGNEVTADDFLYWLDKGPETASGILWNLDTASIDSWEKTGEYQFRLGFMTPVQPMFWMLARDQAWGVVDSQTAMEHATEEDPWGSRWLARNYAGSGEYYIERWDPGNEMVLRAHTEGYWREPPYFDTIVLRVITSAATRALLLQRGEVDIALDLSQEELESLRGADGVRVLDVPSRSRNLVFLNTSIEPFDDVLVRQAVSHLVPYDQIVDEFYRGRALRMYGPLTQLDDGYDGSAWEYEYDVDRAKELLAEAGYDDGLTFTINVMTGHTTARRLAILLQEAARPAGVTIDVRQVTPAVLAEEEATGTAQATLRTDFLNYVDDAYYAMRGYLSHSATNRSHYANERIDEIYEELRVEFDPAIRQELATEYQAILTEDAPQLWLASTPLTYALRADILGFKVLEDSLIWFYPLYRAE